MADKKDIIAASEERPKLGTTAADRVASLTRAGVGFIPLVGSALVEIVGELVPNQRIDRIEDYLRLLAADIARLAEMISAKDVDQKMKTPESIALIEEGGFKAARLISEERRAHVARLVAHGIVDADAENLKDRRLLDIYAELDDGDVALLVAWNGPFGATAKFNPWNNSDLSDKERRILHSLYEASIGKLERLGLLAFSPSMSANRDGFRVNRITGKQEGHHLMSYLGELMLERLEITADGRVAPTDPADRIF